ncbi:alpha/beta fold hydrolase [Microbacterium album]|uniref:Alpha/beta hydrolase n=1 Tax=Microbacterium album TaxID=2053191 RepID=A0A917IGC6_9MICO|nr:alpha/beta hydrolase [Microbacterium album]GGH47715.1 alpha/beta hydrolase [Microbacterium album]
MTRVTESREPLTSEFAYLPGQAERLGLEAPSARRLTLPLDDGRLLSAIRYGEGAPRVVLLHGAGLNAHTWDATAIALDDGAIAIDLAGHGDSSWRDDADYAPGTLAPDVIRGLETWTTGPVVLAGHSLGGLTAAAVAAARADLVRAVVIVDITPDIDASPGLEHLRRFYEQADFPSRDAVVERAQAFGLGGSLEDTRRGVFLNTRVRQDGRVEWKHHFARIAQHALAPAADQAPGGAYARSWDDLAALRVPLTLVRAERGFVDAAATAELSRRVPHARVVPLDAPHNVQEVAPVELARLLRGHADGSADR